MTPVFVSSVPLVLVVLVALVALLFSSFFALTKGDTQ